MNENSLASGLSNTHTDSSLLVTINIDGDHSMIKGSHEVLVLCYLILIRYSISLNIKVSIYFNS